MRKYLFGFSGWSQSGKDQCCNYLSQTYRSFHLSLARPAKDHIGKLFGFSKEQLHGHLKDIGDLRFPKPILSRLGVENAKSGSVWTTKSMCEYEPYSVNTSITSDLTTLRQWQNADASKTWPITSTDVINNHFVREGEKFSFHEGDPRFWTSPREVMQKYMELMEQLNPNVWVDQTLEAHVLNANEPNDQSMAYLEYPIGPAFSCCSDFRHPHQLKRSKQFPGVETILIRVKRPSVSKPPFNHPSETEQTRVRDAAFDFILDNDKDVTYLSNRVDGIINIVKQPNWVSKKWDDSYVLPKTSNVYYP